MEFFKEKQDKFDYIKNRNKDVHPKFFEDLNDYYKEERDFD
jgi:hypothetical protein